MKWPPKDEAKVFFWLAVGALILALAVAAYHGFSPMILKSVGLYVLFLGWLAVHCFIRMRKPD